MFGMVPHAIWRLCKQAAVQEADAILWVMTPASTKILRVIKLGQHFGGWGHWGMVRQTTSNDLVDKVACHISYVILTMIDVKMWDPKAMSALIFGFRADMVGDHHIFTSLPVHDAVLIIRGL